MGSLFVGLPGTDFLVSEKKTLFFFFFDPVRTLCSPKDCCPFKPRRNPDKEKQDLRTISRRPT